jgi:putative NIF3 family GTP cyclohydrolase 1 type 2
VTVQEAIDRIVARVPGTPRANSVDTLKTGRGDAAVTGIVTTFMATVPVLRRAAALGANLVITHEPTFYNHLDQTDWLAADPVHQAKRRLIDEHGIAVFRFHDYWHQHRPDGILYGVLRDLGWKQYATPGDPRVLDLPAAPLADLAVAMKERLGITNPVRIVGDPRLVCRRVGILVGAWGGRPQISLLSQRPDLDVLIVGEAAEWETPEYVRDAAALGRRVALLVLGHAASEEAGMKYLAEWLADVLPGVLATHVLAGDPFVSV